MVTRVELVGKNKCLCLISVHGRRDFCIEKQNILLEIFSGKRKRIPCLIALKGFSFIKTVKITGGRDFSTSLC